MGVLDGIKAISAQLGLGFGLSLAKLIWLGSVSFDILYQYECLKYCCTFERFLWNEIFVKTILTFWLIIYFQRIFMYLAQN